MPEPNAETCAKMQACARLRADGKTQAETAVLLDVSRSTVSHWVSDYPELWMRYMHQAIDERLAEVENETILRARLDLRDKDPIVRSRAIQALLRHCRELRGTKQKHEVTGAEGGPIQVDVFERIRHYEQMVEDAKGDKHG